MLSVVEVCRANLHEEEDGKDHINHRKNHVIDYRLDLLFCGVLVCYIFALLGYLLKATTSDAILVQKDYFLHSYVILV